MQSDRYKEPGKDRYIENVLNFGKEHILAFSIAFIAGYCGYSQTTALPTEIGRSLSLLWASFGFFATEYLLALIRQSKERDEFLERVDSDIDERMDKICPYTALHTDNGSYERITEPLANPHFGKVKWVISKFISEKISTDFGNPESTNEIVLKDMNIHKYSKFSRSLYNECESSIYLTTILTPEEWFGELLNPEDFGFVKENKELPYDKYPVHVKTLLECSTEKKRLVLLTKGQWEECFSNKDACKKKNKILLNQFMHINRYVDTRFVKIPMIEEELPQLDIFKLQKNDIAIYDKRVTTEWRGKNRMEATTNENTTNETTTNETTTNETTTNKKANIGDLILRINPAENLLDLFDFDENAAFYATYEQVLKQIEK